MPITETSNFYSYVTAFLPIITVGIMVFIISLAIYKVIFKNRK